MSSNSHLVEHLNGLFPPLKFPPELARRILTHGSHPSSVDGHNARFDFIGQLNKARNAVRHVLTNSIVCQDEELLNHTYFSS